MSGLTIFRVRDICTFAFSGLEFGGLSNIPQRVNTKSLKNIP